MHLGQRCLWTRSGPIYQWRPATPGLWLQVESYSGDDCDQALRERPEPSDLENPNHQIVTCGWEFYGWNLSNMRRRGSDTESESEDSVDRRRLSAPKWAWCCFYPTEESLAHGIYCFQVPDPDPLGHKTENWKFTSCSGGIAYGADPFDWFEDWDPDKGGAEEPTPYCVQLRRFYLRGEELDAGFLDLIPSYDKRWTAWEVIQEVDPPAGAFYYDQSLHPMGLDDVEWDDWDMQWHINLLE